MIVNSEEPLATIGCLGLIQRRLEENYLAPYMLFLFEDLISGKRIHYCTHEAWSFNYVRFGLIEDCPLYGLGKSMLKKNRSCSVILPWWLVESQSKEQNEVVGARHEHGIGDGVSIAKESIGFRACMGIAPTPNCKDFSKLYLSNPEIFRRCFSDGITLSIREMFKKNWVSKETELKLLKGMGILH
tara:strand:- start:28553 stop:29110 length:558 start_codon:yes stop_codon:yes gene_type:complete